jgi:hypothetical protein
MSEMKKIRKEIILALLVSGMWSFLFFRIEDWLGFEETIGETIFYNAASLITLLVSGWFIFYLLYLVRKRKYDKE